MNEGDVRVADAATSGGVVARVLRVPELRRIEAGFAAFSFSEHATWLAVLVYALERGGPSEVGLVAVVQLLPGILLAPFAAYAGDRFPPQRALAAGYAAQSLAMTATALAMVADAPIAVYAAGAAAATCITFTRPVLASLLPAVTHAPSDLVAANVATGFIEQIGVLVGPLSAGALMALGSPALVFGAAAAATGLAALSALRIDVVAASSGPTGVGAGSVAAQVLAGFATLRREGRLRVLVWLGATAGIVKGIGDVIFVTFADARLDGGGGQSGLLAGAYGLGAILGATGAARLVRSGHLGRQFAVSGLLAGVPLLALAGTASVGPALVLFALLGVGETLLQLTSWVAVQRETPTAVLARVFGILEGTKMAAIALGSLAVTAFVAWTSFTTGFVLLAVLVLVTVLGGVARLRRHGDGPPAVDEAVVRRLLADPIFAPLAAPTVERLARASTWQTVTPGEVVVREGDGGDRYALVVDGTLDVTIGGRPVRTLGPGTSFGEIALLRDVPRTATVTATSGGRLLTVDRDTFLEAVTGHPHSFGTATDVASRLLDG